MKGLRLGIAALAAALGLAALGGVSVSNGVEEGIDRTLELARVLLETSRAGEACTYFWRAEVEARGIGYEKGLADALRGLGYCAQARNAFMEAAAYYREASSIYLLRSDFYDYAGSLTDLATCYQELGLYEQSLDTAKLSLRIWETQVGIPGHEYEVGVVHNNLGHTYLQFVCQLDLALGHYVEAHWLFSSIGHTLGTANSLIGLGGVQLWFGRHREAIDYFSQALPLYKQRSDTLKIADTHSRIGACYAALHDYTAAEEAFSSASGLYQDLELELRCTSAFLYPALNPAAAHLCLMAKDGECVDLLNRCDAALSEGDYDAATGYAELARSYAEGLADLYSVLFPLEARAIIRPTLLKAWALNKLGHCLSASNDYEGALAKFSAAVEELPGTLLQLDQARALRALGHMEEALDIYRSVTTKIERAREETSSLESQRIDFMRSAQAAYQEYLDLLADRPDESREVLYISESARARSFLDVLTLGARGAVSDTEGLTVTGAVDVNELRRLVDETPGCLESNELVVVYAWGREHLFIWTVTREGGIDGPIVQDVEYEKFLQDTYSLRSLLERFDPEASIQERKEQDKEVRRRLAALSRTLITPLEGKLTGKDTVVIVPAGPLWYVPFAALPRNEAGDPLVETLAIAYAPSLASLPGLLAPPMARGAGSVLAFADPERGDLAPLQGLAAAATAFANALGGGTVYAGERASEAKLKSTAGSGGTASVDGGSRFLFFGCHGVFNPSAPLYSYVALSKGSGDDGDLYAREVLDLDLSGTQLVLLLACETFLVAVESQSAAGGLGLPMGMLPEDKRGVLAQLARGDELLGLTRAFLLAGAETVLATQWEVSQEVAVALAKEFGVRLAAGMTAVKALQEAEVRLLRQGHTEPWLWAPFLLVGSWR